MKRSEADAQPQNNLSDRRHPSRTTLKLKWGIQIMPLTPRLGQKDPHLQGPSKDFVQHVLT